jgi:hypothetical protein
LERAFLEAPFGPPRAVLRALPPTVADPVGDGAGSAANHLREAD